MEGICFVGFFAPFFLSFLQFWLWLSNNCESIFFKLFDLVPLPGSHCSFQWWKRSISLFIRFLSVRMIWILSPSLATYFLLYFLIGIFLFFIKLEIIIFVNLLNVLNLNIIEFFTKRISKLTILLHDCIKFIQFSNLTSPYVVDYVTINIKKVSLVGSKLLRFPFFI